MIEEEMITKIFLFDTKSLPTFVGTAGAGAAAALSGCRSYGLLLAAVEPGLLEALEAGERSGHHSGCPASHDEVHDNADKQSEAE